MAEKDTQLGLIVIVFAVFFLFSGMDLMTISIFEPEFATFLAFILVAIGIYLVAKK